MTDTNQLPPIVDAAWLERHAERVVLCEVRASMAGDDVDAPPHRGTRLLTLEGDLSALAAGSDGRHPLPAPDAFAAALGAAGIRAHDRVVAFDAHAGAYAGRLVWMLRTIGQPAALLDGGATSVPNDVVTDSTAAPALVDRPPVAWPASAIADSDDVAAHLAAGGIVVDSRDAARYAGDTEPIDRVAGHIPGAINLPFAGNLRGGQFLPVDELATRFVAVAADPEAIVHCGSGVTACHNALAMEAAGLPRPRLYVGSWSGWTSDPTRPIATGPEP